MAEQANEGVGEDEDEKTALRNGCSRTPCWSYMVSSIANRVLQQWRLARTRSLSCPGLGARRSLSSLEVVENKLLGKVAIVTGGAMGIGESIVRLFLQNGAKVCIVDVEDGAGQKLCQSLGDNKDVCFFHGDVSLEDNISDAVDFAADRFGTLDIFVNNAGIVNYPEGDIVDETVSDFDKIFAVNVKGVFLGMKHAARLMIPRKQGAIVSICSVAGVIGGFASHAYTGSKHAVLGLTRNVAADLGRYGIRVNCVSPYAVPTRLAIPFLSPGEGSDDILAGFRAICDTAGNLKGVDLTADDVAKSVLFLASDDARYISGANLVVDGGATTSNHTLGVFK